MNRYFRESERGGGRAREKRREVLSIIIAEQPNGKCGERVLASDLFHGAAAVEWTIVRADLREGGAIPRQ